MRVGDTPRRQWRRGSAGRPKLRPQSVERAPNGERLTRFYEYAGTRFVLVFEPLRSEGEPRIAAIYLQ